MSNTTVPGVLDRKQLKKIALERGFPTAKALVKSLAKRVSDLNSEIASAKGKEAKDRLREIQRINRSELSRFEKAV